MPIYLTTLRSALHVFTKSTSHLQLANPSCNEEQILGLRLTADMNPLSFQITNLCAIARNLVTIVSSHSALPARQSFPESITGLQNELQATIKLLESVNRESFEGRDTADVQVQALGRTMKGLAYVQEFGIMNLGFHATTLYALFRKEAVPLAKWDYLKGGQ